MRAQEFVSEISDEQLQRYLDRAGKKVDSRLERMAQARDRLNKGYEIYHAENPTRIVHRFEANTPAEAKRYYERYNAKYDSDVDYDLRLRRATGIMEGRYNASPATYNLPRRPLNVPELIKRGAIFITDPHGPDGWETDAEGFSLVTLYNVERGGWPAEAKQHLKPSMYKVAAKALNQQGSGTMMYDGKYNQILWSIKKLGIPDEVAFLDTIKESTSNTMSTADMIAYLRQHHDTNLHQDYLNHINTFSKFVLKNIPVNTLKTQLAGLDPAKVERYKQMDFSKAPPIVTGNGYILDGYHRAVAAKELGIPTIRAYVGVKSVNEDLVEARARYEMTDLDPWTFDQTPAGWRSLPTSARQADAIKAYIDAYVKDGQFVSAPEGAKTLRPYILYWHLGQVLTQMGRNGMAVGVMRQALDNDPGWNAYVMATISFLRKDRRDFDHWAPLARGNEETIKRLTAGWGLPYKQAYAGNKAVEENFADGKVKGKSRPGRVKRAGASCNGSVTDLRARAKRASGEKAKMYHWCANMKSGKKK